MFHKPWLICLVAFPSLLLQRMGPLWRFLQHCPGLMLCIPSTLPAFLQHWQDITARWGCGTGMMGEVVSQKPGCNCASEQGSEGSHGRQFEGQSSLGRRSDRSWRTALSRCKNGHPDIKDRQDTSEGNCELTCFMLTKKWTGTKLEPVALWEAQIQRRFFRALSTQGLWAWLGMMGGYCSIDNDVTTDDSIYILQYGP